MMMRYKSVAVTTLLVLSSYAGEAKVLKNHIGTCQVTIPEDWVIGKFVGATSADGKTSVVVSAPTAQDSFDDLKQTAKSVYPESKVTKSTATDFWMEGKSQNGTPDVYRGIVSAPGSYCIAEAVYKTGHAAQSKAIVATLQAVK